MARKPNPKAPQRRLFKANSKIRAKVAPRIRQLVDDFGGVTSFANAHGMAPKYVYRWLHGMVPSTDNLLKLAITSRVSPEWVLLGKGTRYLNGRRPKAARAA